MLAFIMLGAAFVLVGRNYTLRERQTTIESNAEELSRLASAYVQDGELDDWSFRIAMSAIASSTGNHCFITTTDGTIMICAERAPRCVHLGVQVPENIRLSLESDQRFSGVTTLGGLYGEPRSPSQARRAAFWLTPSPPRPTRTSRRSGRSCSTPFSLCPSRSW